MGYEGRYAVTEDGRIFGFPNKSRSTIRLLKQATNAHGYQYVCLCVNAVRQNRYVHQLVAEVWCEANGKPQVNHKDGNKKNNHASNLEWVTAKENKRHAWDNGITKMADSQRRAASRNITKSNIRQSVQTAAIKRQSLKQFLSYYSGRFKR